MAKAHVGVKSEEVYLGPDIHKCPCCEFTSGMKLNVKKHIGEVHEGKCNICQKSFKTTRRLKIIYYQCMKKENHIDVQIARKCLLKIHT